MKKEMSPARSQMVAALHHHTVIKPNIDHIVKMDRARHEQRYGLEILNEVGPGADPDELVSCIMTSIGVCSHVNAQ